MANSRRDGGGDCDSDGSISWEDFFGSSTDLVPTLLSMYDTLLAERLSVDGGQFVKNLSGTCTSNGSSSSSTRSSATAASTTTDGIGGGWGSEKLETKNGMQSATSGSRLKGPSSSTINGGGGYTAGTGKRCDWNSAVSVSTLFHAGMELGGGSVSNNKSNNNGGCPTSGATVDISDNNKTITTAVLTRAHWTTTNLINQQKYLNTNKNGAINKNLLHPAGDLNSGSSSNMPHGAENQKRPLSVNSIASSASSSSCSSESSSLNVPGGTTPQLLAPKASPEEEITLDLTTDEQSARNHRSAKTKNLITTNANGKANNDSTSSMDSSHRCFSNSATKDCGENATNNLDGRGRISFPIQTQTNFKFCDPNLSYMDRVVMEIVETERTFVRDLQEIISGYLNYWTIQQEEALALDDIKELFSNIEEIYDFNSEFLERLEVCGLNPVEVAKCFVTKNEGFSIYTQYCTNYPRTMSLLTEMMRHSSKLFRERQSVMGHSLPLGSYLLKPVQRILKYHLLLQNIVKHYEPGTEGHETIVEALSAMTNIAHHINDMKRKHEHAVRVQEIQSLLYGWQGEDLTTYGELCAEGTFRAFGCKALRHVFLFDKMVLITKKKEDGVLYHKTHIMCSNLMLIESVPGEPLSFHVIPFDNPRLQTTLQARNLEQKREWTLLLKRVILENYHAVIPSHARQLVMELGQQRPEADGNVEKAPTKRQHSAPEYLERRKQGKSESSLKARLRKARKSDMMSPKESLGRRRKNSTDSSRERSESRDREISIDRKMSSASCPPSSAGSAEKKLVKKLSGWRRKSEPGIYHTHESGKSGGKGNSELMSPSHHGTSNLTLDSTESSIGEEDGEYFEEEDEEEPSQLEGGEEECLPSVEERRESIEEIVGQLVMQNREFQRILMSKEVQRKRITHLRKALTQYQRRQLHEEDEGEESEAETETEDHQTSSPNKNTNPKDGKKRGNNNSSGSNASQGSSSNGIGSSSDVAEMSSENICIEPNDDVVMSTAATLKNVQRTVSDPGNKATLTPRRHGPFSHYDPLSLLWSSFRRSGDNNRAGKQQGDSPVLLKSSSKGKTSIRHTHSFSCSRKEPHHQGADETMKDPLPLPHGDSGVFPNSFTSDSSSSSEANIPTLPAVWLKQHLENLATPNNKSGSLPRSFQVGQQHTLPSPQPTRDSPNPQTPDEMTNFLFKSRLRDGKLADRPITIASDKPCSSDINYDEMEQYMNKFNNQIGRRSPNSCSLNAEDLVADLTPMTSMENINNLHPDHKIYRSSKSSIRHMLYSVTHRLSSLKVNMLTGGGGGSGVGGSAKENINFGSFSNISATSDTSSTKTSTTPENNNGRKMSNGNGLKNLNMLPRNYRKALKQKLRNIVKEDRDSDSENCCESVTCSSGSSGFGSIGSSESSNNLTSKIGARLAHQSSTEQSDYALSKLLLNDGPLRPQSVMSISSTVTSASSTDEKASSGLGESLSGSNGHIPESCCGTLDGLEMHDGVAKSLYRPNRKAINHKELYLSYIDQEVDAQSDSDSADSFYERSFEAIETLLESELFPDSAIYSAEENASTNSSIQGSQYSSSWGLSSSFQDSLDSASKSPSLRHPCFSNNAHLNSISMLAARLSNSRLPPSPVPNDNHNSRRSSRLIRSQAILDKLKHLEQCSQFHREGLPSPSFEGIKSIQERRNELELWKQGRISRGEDECETSSQHSTSTINTVIELSPSKSTSFPSSRRCSDTDSSGGNSPLTERAISRNSMLTSRCGSGNIQTSGSGDPMPKGWVRLLVGKLQSAETEGVE
ncbi:uncharacterized protein LOC110842908 isoform X1 [Folsomia candida]|uniref:uncharacterized protein LOC110842908 isoform X1 n=2 Tax=Folsomia candida TaxID=158441 RepID=UPI001605148A|nr:uncharacterized protein LOC110842908 isoform X1 [Folsomia candida]